MSSKQIDEVIGYTYTIMVLDSTVPITQYPMHQARRKKLENFKSLFKIHLRVFQQGYIEEADFASGQTKSCVEFLFDQIEYRGELIKYLDRCNVTAHPFAFRFLNLRFLAFRSKVLVRQVYCAMNFTHFVGEEFALKKSKLLEVNIDVC